MLPHILVVDDDPDMRDLLGHFLDAQGFTPKTAHDVSSARDQLSETDFDLVLLDVMLPGENGLCLARELSANQRTGIILISGKNSPADCVLGLDVGADDYVGKPFSLEELKARIDAILRRRSLSQDEPGLRVVQTKGQQPCYVFAGCRLDMSSRTVQGKSGALEKLSTTEYGLLIQLVQRPLQILSREELGEQSSLRVSLSGRAVDTQVHRLRQKLQTIGCPPGLLQTVRGRGYQLRTSVTMNEV